MSQYGTLPVVSSSYKARPGVGREKKVNMEPINYQKEASIATQKPDKNWPTTNSSILDPGILSGNLRWAIASTKDPGTLHNAPLKSKKTERLVYIVNIYEYFA